MTSPGCQPVWARQDCPVTLGLFEKNVLADLIPVVGNPREEIAFIAAACGQLIKISFSTAEV